MRWLRVCLMLIGFIALSTGLSHANEEITVDLPGGAPMEFVWIEPGTFMMGGSVRISKGFYLGKYEITQGQWQAVMGTRPWSGQRDVRESPNHPAVYVSWDDMQAFVHQLNQATGDSLYRLPTEAEWEYACRAGTTTDWSFGDDESQLGDYAWYGDNTVKVGEVYAHAVGTKLPNPWGLSDMHGNVYEWVQDWYGDYSSESQIDPQGPDYGSYRVNRGGSFSHEAQYSRSRHRYTYPPDARLGFLGARLAKMGLATETPTSVTPQSWGAIKKDSR